MKQRILEIRQIYKLGQEYLENANIEEASLDAWYLLSHVTGVSRAEYYGHPERELSGEEIDRYLACIGKRCRRIPLQHIIGEQEFMGLIFSVNEDVLIPRQDTETLVEEGLKVLNPGMRILDMCTGSGCILLSLLKLSKAAGLTGTGTDISLPALSVAKKNAASLGVSAEFLQGDLFENVPSDERYDLIISNPPYIPTPVIEELEEEVRLYDPYIALDGKSDGLHFYRRIIAGSISYIKEGGWLMFEIGYDQAEPVAGMMRDAGYRYVEVKKDLAGLDRVVLGRYYGKDSM